MFTPSVIMMITLRLSGAPYALPSVKGSPGDRSRQPHIIPSRRLVLPLADSVPAAVCRVLRVLVSGVMALELQR